MTSKTTGKKRKALVYSTDAGRHCPACNRPTELCICRELKNSTPANTSDHVYIQRESKGRAGKPVTTIKGLPLNHSDLKILAKKLKAKCGVGGTVDASTIIIQGDQREKVKTELVAQGYTVKISGG